MIQNRIDQLKQETEFAEAKLLENVKQLNFLKSDNHKLSSKGVTQSSMLKTSLPLVGLVAKMILGKNSAVYSIAKIFELVSQVVSSKK